MPVIPFCLNIFSLPIYAVPDIIQHLRINSSVEVLQHLFSSGIGKIAVVGDVPILLCKRSLISGKGSAFFFPAVGFTEGSVANGFRCYDVFGEYIHLCIGNQTYAGNIHSSLDGLKHSSAGNNTNNTYGTGAVDTNDYKERVTYDPNGNIRTYVRNGTTTNLPVGVTGGLNMDILGYEYYTNTNQLKRVTDNIGYTGNYPDDIDHQTNSNNYTYDPIGNLISDVSEGITNISWTVYGKIKSITKSTGTINYTYDASGNRITKTYNNNTTWYVRDASGNVMSTYVTDAAINGGI